MEVIINKVEARPFNEIAIGETFTNDKELLMIKISAGTAICFSDEQPYYFNGGEKCRPRDCVIIERDLFENLRRASDYE